MLLCIALVAPLCGPLLVDLLGRQRLLRTAFDAFLIVAIAGLLGLHVLPEGLATVGWPGVPALLLGLVLPKWLHAHDHPPASPGGRGPRAGPRFALGLLGALALALHAGVDGLALAPAEGPAGESLAVAVGLHRAIEGAGVWWLLQGPIGRAGAAAALVGLIGITGLGAVVGQVALTHGFVAVAAALQLVVAGSLVHLLVWHPAADAAACSLPQTPAPGRLARLASAIGALLGALAVVALERHHEHAPGHGHGHPASVTLASEGPLEALAPLCQAAVVALLCAALAHAVSHLWPGRRRPLGVLRGAVVGLFVPACSCGAVALASLRRLQGGTPRGVAAYLLSAPAMGWVGFLASLMLLGPAFTLLRAAAVVLTSIFATLALGRPAGGAAAAAPAANGAACRHGSTGGPWPSRVGRSLFDGLQFALGEMLDFTAPWLAFALLLATVVAANVPVAWVQVPQRAGWDVLLFGLMGLPAHLCAAAGTLLAACLWRAGASAGAVLAFLLVASSLSVASATALAAWNGRAAAARVCGAFALAALGAGAGLNRLLAAVPLLDMAMWPPTLQSDPWDPTVWLAGALLLLSLMRQGLRAFVGQLLWANGARGGSEHHG